MSEEPPIIELHHEQVMHIHKVKPMICGGTTDWNPAQEKHQKLADKVRKDVEARQGLLDEYVVETFRSQLVNGKNYTFKIRVGLGKYIEIRVYEAFSVHNQPPELTDVKVL